MAIAVIDRDLGHILLTRYNLILSMAKSIHYKMWDEIINSLPNVNGCTVEIGEWINNVIPHFIDHLSVAHRCRDYSYSIKVKRVPRLKTVQTLASDLGTYGLGRSIRL